MKKITSVCLIFFIALAFFAGTALAAAPEYTGTMNDDFAVVLIDADSGAVLYKHNEDVQIEPASTTKIMTCILAIENSNLDDVVTISKKAANSKTGSILGIKEKEEIKMQDLLTGMMLASGNDASIAVAEEISGSIESFADVMNEKVKSLEMTSTNFVTPNGLHDENHHTTASDMAKLARYAMQNPTFRDIVKRVSYDMPKTNKQNVNHVDNTNWLLDSNKDFYYEYATGIKTGSTPYAGGCLVSSASKNGMNLICLVFGEKPSTKTQRWKISKELFEWGFDNFTTIDISAHVNTPIQTQIQDYVSDDAKDGLLEFKLPDGGPAYVTLPKDVAQGLIDGTDTLEAETVYDRELAAPVAEGDIFGVVIYRLKETGEEVYRYTLIASRDILKETPGGSKTPVITMTPTPPAEVVPDPDYTLFFVIIIVVAGGLITFLIVRMVMSRRNRHSRKRRRPHYSYRK